MRNASWVNMGHKQLNPGIVQYISPEAQFGIKVFSKFSKHYFQRHCGNAQLIMFMIVLVVSC